SHRRTWIACLIGSIARRTAWRRRTGTPAWAFRSSRPSPKRLVGAPLLRATPPALPSRYSFRRPIKHPATALVGEPPVVAAVAPGERGTEPVTPDDLVPFTLFGRVRGIDDRPEIDPGFDC